MDWIISLDKELLLFFNGMHSDFLDAFMYMVSGKAIWAVFYLGIIVSLIKKMGPRNGFAAIMAIIIVITLADQTASSVFKPLFQRFRPSHEPSLNGLVHLVNGYTGGRFGFCSSHAANVFGLAVFAGSLLQNKITYIFLIAWAILVSYSRIYLGVHYPGDIIVGALWGVFYANVILIAYRKYFLGVSQNTYSVQKKNDDYIVVTWGLIQIAVMLFAVKYIIIGI